jgi:hypothetical protein
MNNLCNDCIFAKWDMDSVENAHCEQNFVTKVIGEGNYVIECSSYKTSNVIRCIVNWIKRNE